MSTLRELNALLIRLGRAEIELERVPHLYDLRTDGGMAALTAARGVQYLALHELKALAVERALAGGVE